MGLQTAEVSDWTRKGTHTTRRARLLPLSFGGWVCDTPGIRQFELWDISIDEVDGYYIEFRPFISYCRFPNCTHIHENGCGVKEAVAQQLISVARYNGYYHLREDDVWVWEESRPRSHKIENRLIPRTQNLCVLLETLTAFASWSAPAIICRICGCWPAPGI